MQGALMRCAVVTGTVRLPAYPHLLLHDSNRVPPVFTEYLFEVLNRPTHARLCLTNLPCLLLSALVQSWWWISRIACSTRPGIVAPRPQACQVGQEGTVVTRGLSQQLGPTTG